MTMLGAQLDDLSALSTRLHGTSVDVGTARQESVATTTNVVGAVGDAARTALDQISNQMAALDQSVRASVAQAESTQWTGANADRFRGAANEFNGAMQAAQGSVTEAFGSFQASVTTMSETLNDFVTQFSAALSQAEASASEMGSAVEAQRSNLDQAMNIGIG